MTVQELQRGKLEAAHLLADIRSYGGIVLRIARGDRWRLYIVNGAGVPSMLKVRLPELQPFAMVLLRELAQ